MVPSLIILTLSIIKLRKSALLIFLTQWGLHLSIISTLLSIECGRMRNVGKTTIKRWCAIILQVTFVVQVLIVMIYWIVLHPLVVQNLKIDEEPFLWYHLIFIHSLPFANVFSNVVFSRVVFIPSHCTYLSIIGWSYSIVNFIGAQYRGQPLYPFLKWQDYKSLIFCLLFNVFAVLLFHLMTIITIKFKKRPTDYNRKIKLD